MKQIIVASAASLLLFACGGEADTEETVEESTVNTEAVIEMENATMEVEQGLQELENHVESLNSDVDSLLNGI